MSLQIEAQKYFCPFSYATQTKYYLFILLRYNITSCYLILSCLVTGATVFFSIFVHMLSKCQDNVHSIQTWFRFHIFVVLSTHQLHRFSETLNRYLLSITPQNKHKNVTKKKFFNIDFNLTTTDMMKQLTGIYTPIDVISVWIFSSKTIEMEIIIHLLTNQLGMQFLRKLFNN